MAQYGIVEIIRRNFKTTTVRPLSRDPENDVDTALKKRTPEKVKLLEVTDDDAVLLTATVFLTRL